MDKYLESATERINQRRRIQRLPLPSQFPLLASLDSPYRPQEQPEQHQVRSSKHRLFVLSLFLFLLLFLVQPLASRSTKRERLIANSMDPGNLRVSGVSARGFVSRGFLEEDLEKGYFTRLKDERSSYPNLKGNFLSPWAEHKGTQLARNSRPRVCRVVSLLQLPAPPRN